MRNRRRMSRLKSLAVMSLAMGGCVIASIGLGGCDAAAVMMDTYERTKIVEVPAEYRGLENHTTAVLLDAPMDIQYEYSGAVPVMTELVSLGISRHVPNARVLATRDVLRFQNANVYWPMMDYSEVANALNADRLVIIDLIEYRLFEQGNSYYWDGRAIADVHVYEAEKPDVTHMPFSKRIVSRFPYESAVGRDQARQADVQLGLQADFCQRIVWLFHNYERRNQDIIDDNRRLER